MRIVLSVDMEGIAGILDARELLACCPEYWDTGRARLTDDVVAAATGLLEGGAEEVILLDNHASGHPTNLLADRIPAAVRIASWNVFDLPKADIDGMLQLGYHPRRNIAGFAPHTYIPGLRLWLNDEEISESHGRVWASETALLGITGHANHGNTLGSLADTPFLAVQSGVDPHRPLPRFDDPTQSAEAIRAFALEAIRHIADAPRPAAPTDATFSATIENPDDQQVRAMTSGGWTRTSDHAFAVELSDWTQARGPLAAAMKAAMVPFLGALTSLDLSLRAAVVGQDPGMRDDLARLFLDRIAQPELA